MQGTHESLSAKAFISFIQAGITVLEEISDEVFKKKPSKSGKVIQNNHLKVEISVVGDIKTRVVFDLPEFFIEHITAKMLGISLEQVTESFMHDAAQELGNIISGTALGFLEELHLNCDISPPIVHRNLKIFSDDTLINSVEFSNPSLGSFLLYMPHQEANTYNIVNVLCVNLEDTIGYSIARFLFSRGIFCIKTTVDNFQKKSLLYPPDIILFNTDSTVNKEQFIDEINDLASSEKIGVFSFGDSEVSFKRPFKHLVHKPTATASNIVEFLREIAHQLHINNFVTQSYKNLNIPKSLKAECIVQTLNGDEEKIPIKIISLSKLTLDISKFNDIIYPEGKILKNVSLLLDNEILPVKQVQIGTTHIKEEELIMHIKHILDTDLKILTTFLYKAVSE